jgi:hypothetical protein
MASLSADEAKEFRRLVLHVLDRFDTGSGRYEAKRALSFSDRDRLVELLDKLTKDA